MCCLLRVVKWFTKCLFYSWLLKICTGLSLLPPSFCSRRVLQLFSTSIPADCICHRMHQALRAVEATCAQRQKQVHTQQSLTFCCRCLPLSSDEHFSGLTHHVKDAHKCCFTTGKHSAVDSYIHPATCQRVVKPPALVSVTRLARCSLTTCRMASFPTRTFFLTSHRNKKPQCTVA